jgi:hypothetical protein
MPSGTLYCVSLVRTDRHLLWLELRGTKSQKASVIDTTVKASQKTEFFDHKYTEGVWEKSAEESIWTEERSNNGRFVEEVEDDECLLGYYTMWL